METLYKKIYDEIVISGKLIVKMNKFMEENTEIPLELKSEIQDTIQFLRKIACDYHSEYRYQVKFREELENMYQEEYPGRDENDYNICEHYACEDCPNFDICYERPEEME